MMRQTLKVSSITQIQKGIYSMTLTGDCSKITMPGQFVNIKLDGFYLRRPISICRWDKESVTIILLVVMVRNAWRNLLPAMSWTC